MTLFIYFKSKKEHFKAKINNKFVISSNFNNLTLTVISKSRFKLCKFVTSVVLSKYDSNRSMNDKGILNLNKIQ